MKDNRALLTLARTAGLGPALMALAPRFPSRNSLALLPDGHEHCGGGTRIDDPLLRGTGVSAYRLTQATAPDLAVFGQSLLFIRLGVCLRMLDQICVHLESRTSQGLKTSQHQSVVLNYGDLVVAINGFLASMESDPSQWEDLHRDVTTHTGKIAKLMGGHGYVEGSVSQLLYASVLLGNLYGAREA